MEVKTVRKGGSGNTELAVGRRFGKYKGEKEKKVRAVDVKEDEVLKQFEKIWHSIGSNYGRSRNEVHDDIMPLIENIHYSSKDVENFSVFLTRFQEESNFPLKAGLLLSALINNGKDCDYVIRTNHLSVEIDYLGHENTKNIVIKGDVGKHIGECMKDGSIVVEGSAGSSLGYEMEGGSIVVEGNAGAWVGQSMKNGSITVKGDVDMSVGRNIQGGSITMHGYSTCFSGIDLRGGEIHLQGSHVPFFFLESIKSGKVYHKGELIFDEFERVPKWRRILNRIKKAIWGDPSNEVNR